MPSVGRAADRSTRGSSVPNLVQPSMVLALKRTEIRAAAADEMRQIAALFAQAFVNDPVYEFLRPGRLRREARLRTMFAAELELYVLRNEGTVWTTPTYDGAVAALPPGRWELPKSVTGAEALRWLQAFGSRLPRAMRVQKAMAGRHIREPHFYVRTIAVRPELQGQGIGSSLMEPTLERADTAGVPVYIEASSERSAALYERLGFRHLGVLDLEGGPPVWPMRRPGSGPD